MSKRTVKVDMFQCDYTKKSGERCDIEGERIQIKLCAMCSKDLCNRHYQSLSVSINNVRHLTYSATSVAKYPESEISSKAISPASP